MKRYEYNYGKNPEGALSTISGYATETTNFGETAFGILNKSTRDEENFTTPEVVSSSTATLFSVGNGTDHDSRKNIIELKADGTVYINGVGQYDGTNPGEATDIADEFQGIHDDITGLNEDVDRIDNTIESIHISEDDENLIYTLLVDGQERGTINIPRDQFLKNVSYNEETNNLEFTFIVRGENNEEVEKQVNVNMTDLEDIYSAGDGLNLENKQFSVKVDADTQPYIEVTANGVKIIGVNEALDKKVSWDESKKVITLPADGSISALRNNGLEGGVLICQRTYDEGATYVTKVGTTKNNLTLNSIERPKIDFADGTSQNVAYESEITDISSSLDNYLPLSGGTLSGNLTINNATLTVQNGLNGQVGIYSNGMVIIISEAAANVLQIGNRISDMQGMSRPIAIDYNAENPSVIVNLGANTAYDSKLSKAGLEVVSDDSTASYMSSGVTISDKTENDLLNAAGGTYDISELETKVGNSLNNFYLNAYSSNNILWQASFKDNGTHGTSVKLSPAYRINGGGFMSSDFYINAPLVTSEANGVMSKEDKAKLDSIDTDALATKAEVGSNIYTDSNYLSKETNLTDAVLQLDEEIKATNDNLDLEHANVEATYAKKTELSGYLLKQAPTASGALYVSGTVSPVSPTLVYSMLNANGITLLDENYESRGSDTELFNTNGGTVSISDITSQVDLSNYATKDDLDDYLPILNSEYQLLETISKQGFTPYLIIPINLTNSARLKWKIVLGQDDTYHEILINGYLKISSANGTPGKYSSVLFGGGSNIYVNSLQGIIEDVIITPSKQDYHTCYVIIQFSENTSYHTVYFYVSPLFDASYIDLENISFDNVPSDTYLINCIPHNHGIYSNKGIYLPYKTTSDLLNAGGSTTPISDIVTQVQAAIVDSAPETLDTLNELAAALGDDPNFATTVTNLIGTKVDNSKWETIANTNIVTSIDGFSYAEDSIQLNHKFILKNDNGNFSAQTHAGKTINAATATTAGVMRAIDFNKLSSFTLGTNYNRISRIDFDTATSSDSAAIYVESTTSDNSGHTEDNTSLIFEVKDNANNSSGSDPSKDNIKFNLLRQNTPDSGRKPETIVEIGTELQSRNPNTNLLERVANISELPSVATITTDGLMPAVDKAKLSYFAIQDGKIAVHSLLVIAPPYSTPCINISANLDQGSGHIFGKIDIPNDEQPVDGAFKNGGAIYVHNRSESSYINIGHQFISFAGTYEKDSRGIYIQGKTSSDLLHAAGGTTTLKTINGESLLGSGDVTTPTPTVNAASGTKTIWTGTQTEYEAVGTKDANTLYFITED